MDPSFDMSGFDALLDLNQDDNNCANPIDDFSFQSFGNGATNPFPDTLTSGCDFNQSVPNAEQWPGAFDDFSVGPLPSTNETLVSQDGLSKPPVPCDYCSTRGLECFFVGRDETGCSSCRALFRECTFVSHKPKPGWLDILHTVTEDVVMESGQVTGTKPLWSNGAVESYGPTRPERTSTRFPRAITLVLKRWMEAHCDNPYPTEIEKERLKEETGLSHSQISTWLANARRRGKARHQRASSPMPVPIIPSRKQSQMNPFERWKNSPPDKEAPVDLIERNIASDNYRHESSGVSTRSASNTGRSKRSSRSSAASGIQSASASSISSHRKSSRSMSLNSSAHSWSSLNSHLSNKRRRRRHVPRPKPVAATSKADKIYQCTFCTDVFPTKYDWARHEKTMHLSLEKWVCHPLGPIVTTDANGSTACVYCHAANPDRDHMDTHSHKECSDRDEKYTMAARTFYRKDHLRQHLKLTHNVPFQPWMEDWKIAPSLLRSRCGFCASKGTQTTFASWQDRADHLAKHFRDGATMKRWSGNHGFDPEVAAQVTNAMPPFMIGHEQTTPDPFSVSAGHYGNWTTDVIGNAAQVDTCGTEAPGLGKWMQAQLAQGLTPTIDDIQKQARLILYGDDDCWNQTVADNDEWIGFFLKAHGLNAGTETADELQIANDQNASDPGIQELIEPELGPATTHTNPYWSDGTTLRTDSTLGPSKDATRRPFPHASPLSPHEQEQLLLGQPSPRVASCWTILTQSLGHWVRVSLANGITPTDEAIQRQARLIVYADDDPWNQSQADNAEWLSLFKKAHGLEASNADKGTKNKGPSIDAQPAELLTPALDFGFDEGMFELNLGDDEAGIHNECSTTAWQRWGGR